MDPHERFYRRSLRDVLVSQNILTSDQADELAISARDNEEPLGSILVSSGYLTAWDLAKTVAAHYQMPVLPLAGYRYDRSLLEGVPASLLHQYGAIPVGRFGRAWSFAVVEPPSRELVEALRAAYGNSMFFFVAECNEVQRLLQEHVKVVDAATDTSWHSLFDSGDQRVLDEMKSTPES